MKRTVYAKLNVDEDKVIRDAKINGLSCDGTIDYVERKIGELQQSGIKLVDAFISDMDDTDNWCRYINYVVSWAFSHTFEEESYPHIMLYDEWKETEEISE